MRLKNAIASRRDVVSVNDALPKEVQKCQSQIGLVGLLNAAVGTWYGVRHRMIGARKRWSCGIHIG